MKFMKLALKALKIGIILPLLKLLYISGTKAQLTLKKLHFFEKIKSADTQISSIENAYVLMLLGDSITTDHISPAGNIAKASAAGKYLIENNVEPKDFNQYGTRRGNFEVMARGTFGNVRIVNKLLKEVGPKTVHLPTGKVDFIYNIAEMYKKEGNPVIIIAGKEYGSGSSRDWAAKGPLLQGVKAVIAESYERIHRSNLVGMGILPLEFINGENAEILKIKGDEKFTIEVPQSIGIKHILNVTSDKGHSFKVKARIDTEPEIEYYKNGGILVYVMKKLINEKI